MLEALKRPASAALLFHAFDLLWLDGRDLRPEPLEVRQEQLAVLLAPHVGPHSPVQLVEAWDGDGAGMFDACAQHGLEGVVSKRLGSWYTAGASRTWLKSKCFQMGEFVAVGWGGRLAHLLLAEAQADGLRYVGRVGTGWTERVAAALLEALASRGRL